MFICGFTVGHRKAEKEKENQNQRDEHDWQRNVAREDHLAQIGLFCFSVLSDFFPREAKKARRSTQQN